MATIQKRNRASRVQVRRKGKTNTATFDTKTEAEAWAITTESKIIEGVEPEVIVNDPSLSKAATVAEAFDRYADEVSPNKGGARWEQIRLKMLKKRYPLFKRSITSITGSAIADWRDKRLAHVSPLTVSQELALM